MSFKVYEEDQGITVIWGSSTVARYIVRESFLQNIRCGGYNSLESIPFVLTSFPFFEFCSLDDDEGGG